VRRLSAPAGDASPEEVLALKTRRSNKNFASRRRLGGESGAAIVEFALVLPFLMLIVVVVLDFGRALNYWVDTTHLASEGARLAAVDRIPEGTSLQTYMRGQADTVELRDGGTRQVSAPLEVCVNPDGTEVGSPVEVRVSTTYRWIPLLGLDVATTDITGSATMRRERLAENVDPGCG
jgi:Flp pilus assembly protein TadG